MQMFYSHMGFVISPTQHDPKIKLKNNRCSSVALVLPVETVMLFNLLKISLRPSYDFVKHLYSIFWKKKSTLILILLH